MLNILLKIGEFNSNIGMIILGENKTKRAVYRQNAPVCMYRLPSAHVDTKNKNLTIGFASKDCPRFFSYKKTKKNEIDIKKTP